MDNRLDRLIDKMSEEYRLDGIVKQNHNECKDEQGEQEWENDWILPNLLVKGVVMRIDQDIKTRLTEVVGLCYDGPNLAQKVSLLDIDVDRLTHISHLRIEAIIPWIERKDEFSTLNYMSTTINEGDVIVGVVLSNDHSIRISLRNHLIGGAKQIGLQDIHTLDHQNTKYHILGVQPQQDCIHNLKQYQLMIDESMINKYDGLNYTFSNIEFIKESKLSCNKIQSLQNTTWAKALYQEGLVCQQTKDYQTAIQQFQYAIQFDKHLYQAYIAKSCLLSNQNKYQQAIQCLQQIHKLQPHNQEVKYYYEQMVIKYQNSKSIHSLVSKTNKHYL